MVELAILAGRALQVDLPIDGLVSSVSSGLSVNVYNAVVLYRFR